VGDKYFYAALILLGEFVFWEIFIRQETTLSKQRAAASGIARFGDFGKIRA
jgi:hypothetical protein